MYLRYLLALVGCTHYIKNDLVGSIGRDINVHEDYYGPPTKIEKKEFGETRTYINSKTGCIYEIDVNTTYVVIGYRILSEEKLCTVESEFGQH